MAQSIGNCSRHLAQQAMNCEKFASNCLKMIGTDYKNIENSEKLIKKQHTQKNKVFSFTVAPCEG